MSTPEALFVHCLRQRRAFNSTDGARWYMVDEPDGDCQRAADAIERLTAERDALVAELAAAQSQLRAGALQSASRDVYWANQRREGTEEEPSNG